MPLRRAVAAFGPATRGTRAMRSSSRKEVRNSRTAFRSDGAISVGGVVTWVGRSVGAGEGPRGHLVRGRSAGDGRRRGRFGPRSSSCRAAHPTMSMPRRGPSGPGARGHRRREGRDKSAGITPVGAIALSGVVAYYPDPRALSIALWGRRKFSGAWPGRALGREYPRRHAGRRHARAHARIYLAGPTASGKTAVGVALARRLGAEVARARLDDAVSGHGRRHRQATRWPSAKGCRTT